LLFASGGGFIPQAWQPSLMPPYLLGLSPTKSPKICWLGPASGENPNSFEGWQREMQRHDCRTYHFNIYQPSTLDFADYLSGMDIIFVGGGSTKNLMALWREWDFGTALRTAWDAGAILSGESAGMICWFQSGLTDSFPEMLGPVKGLGFLPGSANPHYNVRPDRVSRFRELIADGTLDSPGLALDQDTSVLYRDGAIAEIVSGRKAAGAYRLTRAPGGGYEETKLPVRYLGS
jgi:peptidase E